MYAMVVSLSPHGEDDPNIATYAAMLVAAFTLGESIGAMIWARISDNIGRKPALLIGNTGAMSLALIFGCSKNLWMAFGWRFLGGLSNPNITLVNTMIAEMVPRDEQGQSLCAEESSLLI